MRVYRLVKEINVDENTSHLTFFRPGVSFLNVPKDQIEIAIQRFREAHVANYCQKWIEDNKSTTDAINCPESYIDLPQDIWMCKITKEPCLIQGQVFLEDKQKFIDGCQVSEVKKEDIFETVSERKYDGFHHVPGRFLCVRCEQKKVRTNHQYHYPWEFAELDSVTLEHIEVLKVMLKERDIVESASFCPICANCAKELAVLVKPDLDASLHIIEFEIYR